MPADALPVAPGIRLPGTVPLRREYRDVLGRPMTGTATITGRTRTEDGGIVIPAAPVTVPVVAGILEVDLPPDTYTVSASLRTPDGVRISDTATITLDA